MEQLKLYDIYSTWHVPFWQTVWFYRLLIISGALFVVAASIWCILRYKKRNKQTHAPWQIALAQLHSLQKNQYTSKTASKQCYFAITTILKQYLHAQYRLATIGKTDEELIKYLRKNGLLTNSVITHLEKICHGCLYIKFANQEALQQQVNEHLTLSVQIVQDTQPKNPQ